MTSIRHNLDKSSYRRDLQRQIEQTRIQKEAEKRAYHSTPQHPFGPSYNAHTPHNCDFGSEIPSNAQKKLDGKIILNITFKP